MSMVEQVAPATTAPEMTEISGATVKRGEGLRSYFTKGLWSQNAVFRQFLGMCPTLAVTTAASNGLAMGLATTFTLVTASTTVSLVARLVPKQVRLATYIVIIAGFVTMADLFLQAKFPAISKSLGPYIALIIVNCVILGRAEAFASRHRVHHAAADALGMGLGFTGALIVLASVRELFGFGTVFGVTVLASSFWESWIVMLLPPGAFLTLGLLVALYNRISRSGTTEPGGHAHG